MKGGKVLHFESTCARMVLESMATQLEEKEVKHNQGAEKIMTVDSRNPAFHKGGSYPPL